MKPVVFECSGATLAGMLHEASGPVGVLIVPGGAQTRTGAHRMFVRLARMIAAGGAPVLRFDRRGIGDSDGDDAGFEHCADDMVAAAAALRAAMPQVRRIVGVGLCDGAAALALSAGNFDGLVMLNLWTLDPGGVPGGSAVGAHYRRRLLQPASWRRLLVGEVDIFGAIGSLFAARSEPALSVLGERIVAALAATDVPYRLVMAERDATAQAARQVAARIGHCRWIDGADHSFTRADHLALVAEETTNFIARISNKS